MSARCGVCPNPKEIILLTDGTVNRGHKQSYLNMLDFVKVFEKVPPRMLLHKLDHYAIRGPPTSGSTDGSLDTLNK